MQVMTTNSDDMSEGFEAQWPAKIAPHMQSKQDDDGASGGTGTATLTRTKTKKPSMYKVLLLNDDYTPMEFVIFVLQRFFS